MVWVRRQCNCMHIALQCNGCGLLLLLTPGFSNTLYIVRHVTLLIVRIVTLHVMLCIIIFFYSYHYYTVGWLVLLIHWLIMIKSTLGLCHDDKLLKPMYIFLLKCLFKGEAIILLDVKLLDSGWLHQQFKGQLKIEDLII